jgi:hypothetical protein
MPVIDGLLTNDETSPAWWKLYILGTLSRVVNDGRQDLFNAWCTAAGVNPLLWIVPNEDLLSGVGLAGDGKNAICSFQGTRNIAQLVTQAYLSPQSASPVLPGRLHAFYQAIFQDRLAAIGPTIAALQADAPLCFVGHSAGGAIATAMATNYKIASPTRAVSLNTFGAPRVGNAWFNQSVPSPCLRLIVEDDFIPALPPHQFESILFLGPIANATFGFNYVHPRQGWRLWNNGTTSRGGVFLVDNFGPVNPIPYLRLVTCWNGCFSAHHMSNYVTRLIDVTNAQGSPVSLTAFEAINNAMTS